MAQDRRGSRTLLLIVGSLYILTIFALADFTIVLTLFAHRESDATMSTSLVLIFAGVSLTLISTVPLIIMQSIFSVIYISLHLYLAHRFCLGRPRAQKRTYFESISRFLPRLLIVIWIAASANGLIVAARQPRCMSATASHDLWQAGLSCTLHRSATGMAVGALLVSIGILHPWNVTDRQQDSQLRPLLFDRSIRSALSCQPFRLLRTAAEFDFRPYSLWFRIEVPSKPKLEFELVRKRQGRPWQSVDSAFFGPNVLVTASE